MNENIKTGDYVNVTPKVNKEYICEALDKNKDAKWRILINHIPAYSAVVHMHEGYDVRNLFAELELDGLGIDVIISGHQHAYTRTKPLLTNKYEDTVYTESTNARGNTFLLMQPKIADENVIESSEDSKITIATNPEGMFHITVPALIYNAHRYLARDFEVYSGKFGITREEMMYVNDEIVPSDYIKEAIRFSPSSCLFVTVEKKENLEQIKFEFVQNDASETKVADEYNVLDTFIIKKC